MNAVEISIKGSNLLLLLPLLQLLMWQARAVPPTNGLGPGKSKNRWKTLGDLWR